MAKLPRIVGRGDGVGTTRRAMSQGERKHMSKCQENTSSSSLQRRLRIVHFNDVYTLENFPRVKTLIMKEQARGKRDGTLVLVSIGGDFLAPYLLSTLDHGRGMVDVLNSLPTSHAILGNHECDVPHDALLTRMDEFKGTWINSNFSALQSRSGPMPTHDVLELAGWRIGIIGLLCNYPHLYRPSSFDGKAAQIEDPIETVKAMLTAQLAHCDKVIALTHLDLEDDRELARQCPSLAAVLGGHDHKVVDVREGNVRIVKAGMNAKQCAIVELDESGVVETKIVKVSSLDEDLNTKRLVEHHMLKVHALDKMVLTSVEEITSQLFVHSKLSMPLTSQHVRQRESSMATMLCSVLKWELDCDCAMLEAGSVRGDQRYDTDITFAHLKQEMPFANATGIAAIDGKALASIIRESRQQPGPFFLHVDADCSVIDGHLVKVDGSAIKPDRVYSVAVGLDLGFGSKVNKAMIDYAAKLPKRVPRIESAIEAKQIIVAFFAQRFWRRLPSFDELATGDNITYTDLYKAFTSAFISPQQDGEQAAAQQMVHQLILTFDKNMDGMISRTEYEEIFSKHARRQSYSVCAVRRDSCRHFYIRKSNSFIDEREKTLH